MKILSLTQPWATAIALGWKTWETRSWPTNYRGPIGIHAAKGFPRWAREFAAWEWAANRLPVPSTLPRGAVIAVATIKDCLPAQDAILLISDLENQYGDYSPGRWAWRLDNIAALAEPVPAKGSLGLWESGPDLEEQILAQVIKEAAL